MNRIHARVFAQAGSPTYKRLPSFTSFGGYTLVYYAKDGSEFCATCAQDSDTGEHIQNVDVYWEGPPLSCAHCNCTIESSYGDPEGAS